MPQSCGIRRGANWPRRLHIGGRFAQRKGALGRGSLSLLKTNMVVVLIVLAIGQIIGWGTIGLPAVVGRQMAADLGMDIVEVFAGTSVLYLVMGFCAPLLANAFGRHGARRVMIAGAAVATPGFLVLALSNGEVSYFAGW